MKQTIEGIKSQIDKSEAKPLNFDSLPTEKEIKDWIDDVFSGVVTESYTNIEVRNGKGYLVK